jgi:transposase InsO family protein
MDEEQQKEIAVFRFGVIHDLVGGVSLMPGEKERLIQDKCERKWSIPHSPRTRIARSTILRWVKLYEGGGRRLESLYPKERADRGESRSLDEETALSLIKLREKQPQATIPMLISQMEKSGAISPGIELTAATVYRFLHSKGLMNRTAKPVDRRKFEAELPNDLWQSDCMHGPPVEQDGKKRKTYLLAFIDDHSRLVPHGEFYLSEGLAAYLDALRQALTGRGLPRKLYIDNGPAFRSKHLEQVCASLGIALIHSRPYKPQGRGKIERFFKTVRIQFLSGFQGNNLDELNQAFTFWLRDLYHPRIHSATGQSPFQRFTARMQCLRPAPDDLLDHFRQAVRRKVAKDRTISLDGRIYEAPVELIGKQVTLLYHPDQPARVEVRIGQTSHGMLKPVDIHVNARIKRDKNRDLQIDEGQVKRDYRGGSLWGKGEGK